VCGGNRPGCEPVVFEAEVVGIHESASECSVNNVCDYWTVVLFPSIGSAVRWPSLRSWTPSL
jgi:hypothetical protein